MTRPRPFVSVIVPTRGRAASLLRTLNALNGQLERDDMEVVVVFDGPADDTVAALGSLGLDFPMEIVVQPSSGAAAARNRGAACARAPLLLFVDDDVEPLPGLLTAHIEAQDTSGGGVVMGPYWPELPATRRLHPIMIREWWASKFADLTRPDHRFTFRDLLAGNLSMPAKLFSDLGGFDTDFPEAGCEDWELGVRVIESGACLMYAPAARALHHESSTPQKSFRRAWLEGAGDVRIGRRHSGLRPALPFAGGSSSRLNRVARTVAFRAPRVGTATVAIAPVALRILEAFRCRKAWLRLGNIVRHHCYWRGVADLIPERGEIAAFVEGSARAFPEGRPLEVDLQLGVDASRRLLDVEGPKAMTLRYGRTRIAEVPIVPGAERLRGRHLDGFLELFGHLILAARVASDNAVGPKPVRGGSRGGEENMTEASDNVCIIDLEDAPPAVSSDAATLHALVRFRSRPVGWMHAAAVGGRVEVAPLLGLAVTTHWGRTTWIGLRGALSGDAPRSAPSISVVVCTRNRASRLEGCLRAIRCLEYPHYEVVIVDNAPDDESTLAVADRFGARRVVEPIPGLDRARNRGIDEARHDIIAFTDDDARPDSLWLTFVARAFAVPDVMAVTGLIAPVRIRTKAERIFEFSYGGMVQSLDRITVGGSAMSSQQLLWSSALGAGANMAFRREVFDSVGRFDPCLDVGTPTGGAGDLDMFHRVLARGHKLVYEPAAIVLHEHRASMHSLRRQLFDNGRGFCSYLMTCARNRTLRRSMILWFALRSWLIGWVLRRLVRPNGFPRLLALAELAGTLLAPYYYFASRRLSNRRQG